MAEAIRSAMSQARIGPDRIDYISAHGSGTKQNDRHETAAFKRALGEAAYRIPISSIKSMIGHSLGAIGSIEMAACVLAIDSGVIPPTANWTTRDPECDLDYTPNVAREVRVQVALSVGSGFGGFQSAMLLARQPGPAA
jgi:minimal PKS ketosynthase (KS/KS alpha)